MDPSITAFKPIIRRRGMRGDEDEGDEDRGGDEGNGQQGGETEGDARMYGKVTCVALHGDDGHDSSMEEEQVEAEGGSTSPAGVAMEEQQQQPALTITCNAHGCKAVCNSVAEYEAHYSNAHSYVCHECHRAFPNERILDRHITERHDPFFRVLSERQPMYECLVEGCGGVFKSEHGRHLHLVDKHKFPRDFKYDGYHRPHHKTAARGGGQSLAVKANANREKQLQKQQRAAKGGEGGEMMAVDGPASSSSPGAKGGEKTVKCVYFNLPSGCRRGAACHFRHVSKEHHHHEGKESEQHQQPPQMQEVEVEEEEGGGSGCDGGGGGIGVNGMEVEDLTEALHDKLRLPKAITFGRRAQDNRRLPG